MDEKVIAERYMPTFLSQGEELESIYLQVIDSTSKDVIFIC
jgi:hypothetical protein